MRIFLSFCMICLLGLGVVAGGIAYGYSLYTSKGTLTKDVQLIIPKGTGVGGIASLLKDKNIIENPLLFKVMARVTDVQSDLKAGEYQFFSHVSMKEVFSKLSSGEIILRQITIPEGYTSFEIVRLLKKKKGIEHDIKTTPREGTLLPNTYSYQSTDTAHSILDQMETALTDILEKAWNSRANNLPFKTKREAIILASIIEKETGIATERAKISGVFVNRLNKGMPLQTDPTVIYAITKGAHKDNGKGPLGRRLLRKDLSIDSPYNTYKYAGLPKGPICNPGKDAIIASLNPEKHNYFYFVADGTGGHIFSKTLAEHNRNVAQWRKIRARKLRGK